MPAGMKSVLRNMVDSNRAALQFLREGAKHEQSRYPVDLTKGFETMLPHLVKVRDAAKLLQYSAVLHAEDQQSKEAVKTSSRGWRSGARYGMSRCCSRNSFVPPVFLQLWRRSSKL